jgi:hypothetical protein
MTVNMSGYCRELAGKLPLVHRFHRELTVADDRRLVQQGCRTRSNRSNQVDDLAMANFVAPAPADHWRKHSVGQFRPSCAISFLRPGSGNESWLAEDIVQRNELFGAPNVSFSAP